jgi:hypothetical protein
VVKGFPEPQGPQGNHWAPRRMSVCVIHVTRGEGYGGSMLCNGGQEYVPPAPVVE